MGHSAVFSPTGKMIVFGGLGPSSADVGVSELKFQ